MQQDGSKTASLSASLQAITIFSLHYSPIYAKEKTAKIGGFQKIDYLDAAIFLRLAAF
ncbi:hypothetical protein FD51_GL000401 [Lacticaseibacillus zeae DSM 20178 = KCTC 3804]|uniref:Uncharacterized protein n=1 Tax=Lacticaseibacillus zeae DSM 20178 = KCTC 3804 TaxID=1423816 RepID=A0A0R1EWJ0_LACZE|nr:hypothetical protein FD51_GL000401 [Lacticaseibacillus zeae DSM 20178 = KCTC 3804]